MKRQGIFLLLLASVALSCKQTQDEKPQIIRDNAEINYNVYGDGGATLLFVHGAFIDQTYWDEQVKFFQNDYKVVTLDLPGHGKSGKGRKHWSVRGFAEDIYTVIKKLKLKNVVLIGHSMGGDVNLMEATYRPKNIIGFIGIDNFKNAATKPSKKEQKEIDAFMKQVRLDIANTTEKYVRQALVSDSTPVAVTDRLLKDARDPYRPMAYQLWPQLVDIHKAEKNLMPELGLKMHLINVDYFPTDEKPLKKYLKHGYDIRHMKGTSHYPMLENPKELNRLIQETLDQIARENDVQKAGY